MSNKIYRLWPQQLNLGFAFLDEVSNEIPIYNPFERPEIIRVPGKLGDFALLGYGLAVKSGPCHELMSSLPGVLLQELHVKNPLKVMTEKSISYYKLWTEIDEDVSPQWSTCQKVRWSETDPRDYFRTLSMLARFAEPLDEFFFPSHWPIRDGIVRYGGMFLCMGEVKSRIEDANLTNVRFTELGPLDWCPVK